MRQDLNGSFDTSLPIVALEVPAIRHNAKIHDRIQVLSSTLRELGVLAVMTDPQDKDTYDAQGIKVFAVSESTRGRRQQVIALDSQRLVPHAWRRCSPQCEGDEIWLPPNAGYNSAALREDTFTWAGISRLLAKTPLHASVPAIIEIEETTLPKHLPPYKKLLVRRRMVRINSSQPERQARLLPHEKVIHRLNGSSLLHRFISPRVATMTPLAITKACRMRIEPAKKAAMMNGFHSIRLVDPLWRPALSRPLQALLRWKSPQVHQGGYLAPSQTEHLDIDTLFTAFPDLQQKHATFRADITKRYGQLNLPSFSYLITPTGVARPFKISCADPVGKLEPSYISVEAKKLAELAYARSEHHPAFQ